MESSKMTQSIAKVMWKEINDDRAECLNGGGWLKDLTLGSVGAIQINGGDGVQNNYYIFNIFLGGNRHRK
jgi:hypothetical protein